MIDIWGNFVLFCFFIWFFVRWKGEWSLSWLWLMNVSSLTKAARSRLLSPTAMTCWPIPMQRTVTPHIRHPLHSQLGKVGKEPKVPPSSCRCSNRAAKILLIWSSAQQIILLLSALKPVLLHFLLWFFSED